jgi:hypothetical protein
MKANTMKNLVACSVLIVASSVDAPLFASPSTPEVFYVASTYGEAWLSGSDNNAIIGKNTYTNQTIQIAAYASGNKHVNAFFDGPGEYRAAIYDPSGGFANSIFSWNSTTYLASAGYLFRRSGWPLSSG